MSAPDFAAYLVRLDDDALGVTVAAAIAAETAVVPDVRPAVIDRLERDAVAYPEHFARRPRAPGSPTLAPRASRRRPILLVLLAVGVALVLATAALLLSPLMARAAGDEDGGARTGPGFRLSFEALATGFDLPLYATGAGDGSGDLLVVEQRGRILRVDREGRLDGPFLDIGDRVRSGGEQGLLGLALHPGWPLDPRLFIDYTREPDGASVVSEVTVRDGAADPASERVLLVVPQPYANHNGGMIAFDHDGYLLIGMGDGGGAGDPGGHGQDPTTLLGALLRIDVDGVPADGRAYGIPPDNGFADDPSVAPEIHAMGLRNPWRFSVDPATGDVLIGDVGQGRWEEIDVDTGGRGGLDFGWNELEGFECYLEGCLPARHESPALVYGHDLGCSVVGGIVYRGSRQPLLEGAYLFGDYCSGRIWAAPASELVMRTATPDEVGRLDGTLVSFGTDDGEPLLVDRSGTILRVVAREASD